MGRGIYRSGWERCCVALAETSCRFVIEDFFEKTFGLNADRNFHDEPFVAFFHYPPDISLPYLGAQRLVPTYSDMFASRAWELSVGNLKAALCFTSYLAEFLEDFVDVPIVVVKHPTETEATKWSFDAFGGRPRVVQVGEFYRDTRAIFRLDVPFEKWRLLDRGKEWIARWDAAVARYTAPVADDSAVREISRVTDDEYDEILSSSVVLSSMMCASASNVIVECIARSTPVIANRIPPVVEYLGADYPLYLDAVDRDPQRFFEQVRDANLYLDHLEKEWLSYESFKRTFVEQISGIEPEVFP